MTGHSMQANPIQLTRYGSNRGHRHHQEGVTLIVVLVVLIIVTVLGLGAAQIAVLGERSTRYDRDYLIASQAAEAALMDAEFDIRGPNTAAAGVQRVSSFNRENYGAFIADCGEGAMNRGLCMPVDASLKPVWATVNFLDDTDTAPSVEYGTFTGRQFDAASAGIKPELPPRYIIELVEDTEPGTDASAQAERMRKMYRITAIGFGPKKEVQVLMQIAFRKEKG